MPQSWLLPPTRQRWSGLPLPARRLSRSAVAAAAWLTSRVAALEVGLQVGVDVDVPQVSNNISAGPRGCGGGSLQLGRDMLVADRTDCICEAEANWRRQHGRCSGEAAEPVARPKHSGPRRGSPPHTHPAQVADDLHRPSARAAGPLAAAPSREPCTQASAAACYP